jgi:hypothetical protein
LHIQRFGLPSCGSLGVDGAAFGWIDDDSFRGWFAEA